MSCPSCVGKEYPPNETNTPYIQCAECGRDLSTKQRTSPQNRLLHAWCEELSTELNNRGLDMREVLKPEIDIPWDKNTVKRYLVHPIIKAKYQKDSTANLSTKELSEAIDILNRHLINKFEVDLPFEAH